jgi:hypothetical protein
VNLSSGGRTDQKLLEKIKKLVQERAGGTRSYPALPAAPK